MVSYKPSGRLGNAMFQICTMIAYARKHNIEFSMPSETNSQKWNPIYFSSLINEKWVPGKVDIVLKEKEYFRYDELPFKEEWRGKQIVLDGYFQNFDYFKEYREEIIKILNISKGFNKHTVSVHVRRGDYLTIPNKHIVPNKEWYEKAMSMFPDKSFIFYSDDLNWCKDNFINEADCYFSDNEIESEDFCDIAHCGNHINSSSTFSLMAAWLSQNPDKKVITPIRWFVPEASNEWTQSIIPKEWIKL